MNRIFFLILFALLLSSSAYSNESIQIGSDDVSEIQITADAVSERIVNGPPKPNEIIGYWRLVEWPKKSLNKVNPWPLPYQYFAFFEDGQYVTIMSSDDNPVKPDDLNQLKSTFGAYNPTYKWQNKFIIVTNPTINDYKEIWGMNIIRIKDPGMPFGEGDLLMSLAGGNKGNAVYYRWLTRIK